MKKLLQGRVGDASETLRNDAVDKKSLEDFSKFLDEYDQFKQELQDLEETSRSLEYQSFYENNKNTILNKYKDLPDKVKYYKDALKTNPALQEVFYGYELRENGKLVFWDDLAMNAERTWNDLVRVGQPKDDSNAAARTLTNYAKGSKNPLEVAYDAVQPYLNTSIQQLGNVVNKIGDTVGGFVEDLINEVQLKDHVSHQRAVRKDIAEGHLDEYLPRM